MAVQFDYGTGFQAALKGYQARIKDIAVLSIVFGLAQGIIFAILDLVGLAAGSDPTGLFGATANLGLVLVGFFVSIVVEIAVWFASIMAFTPLSLAAVDGDPTEMKDVIARGRKAMGGLSLYFLLLFVGYLLCILPGVVLSLLLALVPFAAVERRTQESSLSAGWGAAKENFLPVLLMWLAGGAVGAVAGWIGGVLYFIPVAGYILGAIIEYFGIAAAFFLMAPVFRASTLGGSVMVTAGGQVPAPQQGYPQQPGGYAPQQGYQQPQQPPPGYPPQAPPQQPGYPPQQPPPGYPPQ